MEIKKKSGYKMVYKRKIMFRGIYNVIAAWATFFLTRGYSQGYTPYRKIINTKASLALFRIKYFMEI
jgi:hypothetical protein